MHELRRHLLRSAAVDYIIAVEDVSCLVPLISIASFSEKPLSIMLINAARVTSWNKALGTPAFSRAVVEYLGKVLKMKTH